MPFLNKIQDITSFICIKSCGANRLKKICVKLEEIVAQLVAPPVLMCCFSINATVQQINMYPLHSLTC